mmetsp:Transcript_71865/g.208249  ORF Transcript_71865/g.208249 Transcript_71865/m.208249 type:complete len:758 (+) Transcript_71865:87-2360(+)
MAAPCSSSRPHQASGDQEASAPSTVLSSYSPARERLAQGKPFPVLTPRLSSGSPNRSIGKPSLGDSSKHLEVVKETKDTELFCPGKSALEAEGPHKQPVESRRNFDLWSDSSTDTLSRNLGSKIDSMEQRIMEMHDRLSFQLHQRLDAIAGHWQDCKDQLHDLSINHVGAGVAQETTCACAGPAADLCAAVEQLHAMQSRRGMPLLATSRPATSSTWRPARSDVSYAPNHYEEDEDGYSSTFPSPRTTRTKTGASVADRDRDGDTETTIVENGPSESPRSKEIWNSPDLVEREPSFGSDSALARPSQEPGNATMRRMQRNVRASVENALGDTEQESRIYRLSQHPLFLAVGIAMTLLNCIVVAADADSATVDAFARAFDGAESDRSGWATFVDYMQRAFLGWLCFEVIVNIAGTRSAFLFGPDAGWNIFDCIVLLVSTLMMWLAANASPSYIRVVRIFRVLRVFGAVRFIRYSESLQRMLASVGRVAITLCSTAFLLFIVIYIVGVAMMESVVDFVANERVTGTAEPLGYAASMGLGPAGNIGLLQDLRSFYGGFWITFVTLFRSITGSDWTVFAAPLAVIGSSWGAVWLAYIFCIVFGFANVIIGIVADIVRRPLPNDRAIKLSFEMKEQQSLERLFIDELRRHGKNEDAPISKGMFNHFVARPSVIKRLRHLGLNVEWMYDAFFLIDVEDTGFTTAEDIARSLMQMREGARCFDIRRLMREVHRLHGVVVGITSKCEAVHDEVRAVGVMLREASL